MLVEVTKYDYLDTMGIKEEDPRVGFFLPRLPAQCSLNLNKGYTPALGAHVYTR